MTGSLWRSAFVAALFAIHPINVESVAWIAERKNVLSTFFWILTMLSYAWYVKQPSWKRYLPVFFSFALGLMSKVMLVTLPFVLLLMDYWPLHRIAVNDENTDLAQSSTLIPAKKTKISFLILEKIPLFVLTAVSIALAVYAANAGRTIASLEMTAFTPRINNAVLSYALYVKKLFWPVGLSVFYPYADVAIWQVLVSAVFLLTATILVLKYFRKYPFLFVGWFWYLGTLVPVIGIVRVGSQAMADRYAYIPFIGLFIIIAWGTGQIMSKVISLKKLFILALTLIIMLFMGTTYSQIKIWHNTVTLFRDAIENDPENYLAYNILGVEATDRGDYSLALQNFSVALKLKPKLSSTYNNIGNVFLRMGKPDEAIENYKKSLAIEEDSAVAHNNLATALLLVNKPDEAILHLQKALRLNPDYISALNNMGIALCAIGRLDEASMYFGKIVLLIPYDENAKKSIQIIKAMKSKKSTVD